MRIFHPRPQPGRQKFIGVEFRDGVAEVDELHPERRTALIMHGYTIEEDAVAETLPLTELTVAELREIARFEGIELPTRAKKADILSAIFEASYADVDGQPLDTGDEAAPADDKPATTAWPSQKATDFPLGA